MKTLKEVLIYEYEKNELQYKYDTLLITCKENTEKYEKIIESIKNNNNNENKNTKTENNKNRL